MQGVFVVDVGRGPAPCWERNKERFGSDLPILWGEGGGGFRDGGGDDFWMGARPERKVV